MRVMFEIIDTYIYFIQMQNGPIKIGRSVDPYERLTKLQVGSPYELQLLYFFPGGAKSEHAMKYTLIDDKIRGEWFWPTSRVFREIDAEKAIEKKNNWFMEGWNPEVDFKDNRLTST